MKKTVKKYFPQCLLLLALFIYGCEENATLKQNNTNDTAKNEVNWVQQEILLNIKDMQSELRGIRKIINEIEVGLSTVVNAANKRGRSVVPNKVALGGKPILGNKSAGIAIIEFTDYQCPYCGRHSRQVLPKILEELVNSGRVLYQVRDYPLGFHNKARDAAIAANCAGEQGKYFGMHDALFANQNKLGRDFYISTGNLLALNPDQFIECLDNPDSVKAIDADIAYGNEIGVTGTPKFFIGKIKDEAITNVKVVSGAQAFGAFSGVVEKLGSL
jgi:protein-disulfide isomerase